MKRDMELLGRVNSVLNDTYSNYAVWEAQLLHPLRRLSALREALKQLRDGEANDNLLRLALEHFHDCERALAAILVCVEQ